MVPVPDPVGLLVVDKPSGVSSHDVVARARRLLGTRRVGHAGTLDPMATGVMVLGVGWATRLLTYVVGHDKTYEATVRLGASTTTDDAEGDCTGGADASQLSRPQIEAALEPLRGPIEQRPSAVSAIKVDGRRAYARVRAGEDVELAARPVVVRRLEVLDVRPAGPGLLDVDVLAQVSSGTYVRALARDLGEALGVGGHLTVLRRVVSGPFTVEEAVQVPGREADEDQLDAARDLASSRLLGLPEAAARFLDVLRVDEDSAARLGHGQRLAPLGLPPGRLVAVLDGAGRLVALVEDRDGAARPALVVPPELRR